MIVILTIGKPLQKIYVSIQYVAAPDSISSGTMLTDSEAIKHKNPKTKIKPSTTKTSSILSLVKKKTYERLEARLDEENGEEDVIIDFNNTTLTLLSQKRTVRT